LRPRQAAGHGSLPLLTVDVLTGGVVPWRPPIDLATHCDHAIAIDPGYRSWPSIWLSISIAYTICDPILRLMLAIGIHRTLNNMVFSRFLIANPNDWPLFRFGPGQQFCVNRWRWGMTPLIRHSYCNPVMATSMRETPLFVIRKGYPG